MINIRTYARPGQKLAVTAVAILSAVTAYPAIAQALPGSFASGPSGAASYSIPIQQPPGIAGMEAKLALRYNSQGGNGVVGAGWSLDGLSSIQRCPRTKNQDGIRGRIEYNLNDRYCLDGQRLLAISGADGADKTEYRTEQESYSKVISYAETGASSGPGSFIVKTRAGLTMEFGKTEDSRVEAQGKTDASGHGVVSAWALNKVTDAKGNFYTVSYVEDWATGQHYPSRIDTGTATTSGFTGSVLFVYDNADTTLTLRPDILKSYTAGSATLQRSRLTKIIARTGTNTALDVTYSLSYDPAAPMSILTGVKKCVAGGSCLPETKFTNQYGRTGIGAVTLWADNNNWASIDWKGFADFNGDGLPDLWYVEPSSSRVFVRLSTGSGFAAATLWANNNNWAGAGWMGFADFDGDGKADLWYVEPSSSRVFVRLSTGSSLAAATLWADNNNWASIDWRGFEDFNGDGLPDLWYVEPSSSRVFVRLSTGSGFAAATLWADNNNWAAVDWKGFADFNGDGLPDLWYVEPSSSRVFVRLSTGSSFATATLWADNNNWSTVRWKGFQDFNGDGNADLWFVESGTSKVKVRLSTGSGFAPIETWSDDNDWAGVDWMGFNDFNGDGLPDLWYVKPSSSIVMVRMSNGSSFLPANEFASNNNWAGLGWLGFDDFNGDGVLDLWFVQPSSSLTMVRLSGGVGSAQVSTIDNGLTSVSLNYQSLPQASLGGSYTRTQPVSAPLVSVISPSYKVLTRQQVPNGIGGTRDMLYTYDSAISEREGRGMLGFRWTQTKDNATGLVNRTYYRQDFPYIGMVDKVGRGTTDANWSNLALSTNEYSFKAFIATDTSYASPVSCTDTQSDLATCKTNAIKPGNRYIAYPSKVVEKSWDWNDQTNVFTAMPQKRTSTVLNNWADPTQIKVEVLDTSGAVTGFSKTTDTVYSTPDVASWKLGRVIKSSVTAASP